MTVHSQNQPRRGRGRPAAPGRKDQILEAALRLFAERGFHGTSMPELAAAAGIAPASIYRHFPSKEALVNELYRACKQLLAARLLGAVTADAPLRDQFHQLWRALYAFACDQPRAFAFLELHHHGDYLDGESRALELRVLFPIAKVVERGAALGTLKLLPTPALIVTVWGAFVGMVKAARAGYFELTDELCDQVELTAWDAIAAVHR